MSKKQKALRVKPPRMTDAEIEAKHGPRPATYSCAECGAETDMADWGGKRALCEDCAEKLGVFRCDRCLAWTPQTEAVSTSDLLCCPKCLTLCADCGLEVPSGEGVRIDDEIICRTCAETR